MLVLSWQVESSFWRVSCNFDEQIVKSDFNLLV